MCRLSMHLLRDTASPDAVGLASSTVPEAVDGLKHICHFRHALALDEKHISFLPACAVGSEFLDHDSNACPEGDIKEVWFEGSHSDMYVNFVI